MTGQNVETRSFVSEKNTHTDSVLFVMKTPAITIPEQEKVVDEDEKKTSPIQKFFNLFHFGKK